MWDKIKHWSGWSTAGSIFNARMTAFVGILVAGIGAMDWSPMFALVNGGSGFNWKQVAAIGSVMFAYGVLSEIVRRYKATDI